MVLRCDFVVLYKDSHVLPTHFHVILPPHFPADSCWLQSQRILLEVVIQKIAKFEVRPDRFSVIKVRPIPLSLLLSMLLKNLNC